MPRKLRSGRQHAQGKVASVWEPLRGYIRLTPKSSLSFPLFSCQTHPENQWSKNVLWDFLVLIHLSNINNMKAFVIPSSSLPAGSWQGDPRGWQVILYISQMESNETVTAVRVTGGPPNRIILWQKDKTMTRRSFICDCLYICQCEEGVLKGNSNKLSDQTNSFTIFPYL